MANLHSQNPPSSSQDQELLSSIHHTAHASQLEDIGKKLDAFQFLSILNASAQQTFSSDKLLPLLVGLPASAFIPILKSITSDQLELLKKQGPTEPLQHHLYLFSTHYEKKLQDYSEYIDQLQLTIQKMDREQLTFQELASIEDKITSFQKVYKEDFEIMDKALALAWNSNRIDLIQKLSQLKEHIINQLIFQVGNARSETSHPSGLFETLERSLFQLFEIGKTQTTEFRLLKNEDSSIEVLAKFSVWYLKDYWELGLLPSVKEAGKIELNLSHKSAKNHSKEHEKLFHEIQNNLDLLGIGSVEGIKKAKIFSKPMLQSYIVEHQHKFKRS